MQSGDTAANIITTLTNDGMTASIDEPTLMRISAPFGVTGLGAGTLLHVPVASAAATDLLYSNPNTTDIYDPTSQMFYQVGDAVLGGNTSGELIVDQMKGIAGSVLAFAAGAYDSASIYGGNPEVGIAMPDGTSLGTLSVNAAAGTAIFTMPSGLAINLPSIPANAVVGASIGQTPEQALLAYLADLGDNTTAPALDALNYNYENPTGAAYTVTGTPDYKGDVIFGSGNAPGAVITGQATTQAYNAQGQLVTVPATNILDGEGDLTQDQISGIQEMSVYNSVTLTGAEFNGFSKIVSDPTNGGAGFSLTIDSPGSYSLNTPNITGVSNFIAGDWGGTTLTGSSQNGQTLTASLYGNDTLYAGSGSGDILIAGNGVDKLVGGAGGGDTFETAYGNGELASGSTITGYGGGNVLEVSGNTISDISGATVTGVQTLDLLGDITLTNAQFESFSTITGNGGITAATNGTYSLANVTGEFAISATPAVSATLIDNNSNSATLSAMDSSGNDVLIAGGGVGDSINIEYSTGNETLTLGGGAGDEIFAENSSGTDSLTAGSGAGDTFWLQNSSGSITLNAGDGSNDKIYCGTGTENLTLGNGAGDQIYGGLSGNQALAMGNGAGDNLYVAGSSGNDTLTVGNGAGDQINALGGTGTDILTAGIGANDVLIVQQTTGNDILNAGNGGGDILNAILSTGADTLNAGAGGDILEAGSGIDTLNGGTGNDTFVLTDQVAAGTKITGGGGSDILKDEYVSNISGVNISGVSTLYDYGNSSLTLTSSQFNQFTTLIDGSGSAETLAITGVGSYNIASDTLMTSAPDITGLSISGVTTLDDNSVSLAVTAAEMAEFTTLVNAGSAAETLLLTGNGTYNLGSDAVTGAFVFSAAADTGSVTLTGSNANNQTLTGGIGTNTITSGTGTDDVVNADGTSDIVTANGTYAWVNANGAGDTVTANATGDVVYGNASNQTITASGAVGTVNVSGTNDKVNANGAEVWTFVNGTGDTVTASAASTNDNITVNAATDTINANGAGDTLALNGTGDTVVAGANGVWLTIAAGSTGDTITASSASANDNFTMSGGSGTHINIAGTNDYVHTTGSGNIVSLTGTDAWVDLAGSGDSATLSSTGGTVNVGGSGSSVTVNASSGTGDTVNLNSTNDKATISSSNVWININGSGDSVGGSDNANTININGTSDTVSGSDDWFNIGNGVSTQIGGGADAYYDFGSTFGTDTINNLANGAATTANGDIGFGSGITDERLWFQQSGNNLLIDLLGTKDQITVDNWFGSNAGAKVAEIQAGSLEIDSQLASLVSAMAAYASANSGFNPATATSMPTNTALQNAIAASWHS